MRFAARFPGLAGWILVACASPAVALAQQGVSDSVRQLERRVASALRQGATAWSEFLKDAPQPSKARRVRPVAANFSGVVFHRSWNQAHCSG